jgi:MFS transporter, DHA2 family, multidrug resistance protein
MASESIHKSMSDTRAPYILLLAGVLMAALAEALAGTALSFGRIGMWGDLHTTSDEFDLLDVGYTAAKLCGYMMVPALYARFRPLFVLLVACGLMTAFSVFMTLFPGLFFLVGIRVVQGVAGGIILVGGQTLLFNVFSRKLQPLAQFIFALGAVVAPATFASALQGWMVDTLTWEAIFLGAAVCGLTAFCALSCIPADIMASSGPRRADFTGFILFAVAAVCLTYIAQEGSRWNWFETPHITALTVCGLAALLACILRWVVFSWRGSLIRLSVFGNLDFCFGFLTSFVAGVALFGSTSLIPGFTLNILDFTATEAGFLNAPGGLMFCIGLAITTLILSFTRVNPLATVPLGILLIMAGMWLLSSSTSESGSADLLIPLLVRGTGLGFLFLSLTIYALGGLTGNRIAQGVALFTTHRQFGGLFGVAFLQRYLDHQNALNSSILSSHLETGGSLLAERLQTIQAALQSRGMEAGEAAKAAVAMLKKSLSLQGGTLSYNEAFFAIVLVFFIAAPLLIAFKIWLSKLSSTKAATHGGK